jgi:hypothetical protein
VFCLAKVLHLGARIIGLTLVATEPGAVAVAALTGKAQRTLGVGTTIIGALTLFTVVAWLIPLTLWTG